MKRRVDKIQFLLLILLLGTVTLSAETLYLRSYASVSTRIHLGNLLARQAESDSLNKAILPVKLDGGALYLSSGEIADMLSLHSVNIVGHGVWAYAAEAAEGVDESRIARALSAVKSEMDEKAQGISLAKSDFVLLTELFSNGNPRLQLTSGAERLLYSADDGSRGAIRVAVGASPVKGEQVPAGSRIAVRIIKGGLVIEADARTSRSAAVGELVPLTLNVTRQRFIGRLTGSSAAEIRL